MSVRVPDSPFAPITQIFQLPPSTLSVYLNFGLRIWVDVVRIIPEASIAWPKKDNNGVNEFWEHNKRVLRRSPMLGRFGIFGFMVCNPSTEP